MPDFLTTRAKFFCVASPAVNFSISESGKVTHKGDKVLTTSTKLSGVGTCTPLTVMAQGTRIPCQFQQMAWLNFDLTKKAGGKNLLTNLSFCNCPVTGSVVKVKFANAQNFTSSNFSAKTISALKINSSTKTNATAKNNSAEVNLTGTKVKQEKNFVATKTSVEKIFASPVATEIENVDEKKYILRCLECERQNCKYRLENFGELSDAVNSNSKTLADNYNDYLQTAEKFTVADESYKNSLELGGSWKYAAHHIICGNQVFKQVPEVVKVANLCKYDINCAENCIMLPSYREGHGNFDKFGKSASTFDVMSLTGMQCHIGNHSYSFSCEELAEIKKQIERRTGKPGKVKSYAEILIDELQKIKFATGEKICPAQFVTRMNKLSAKVRDKLAAFKDNPANSYPYFVSREAYLFAFKVPRLRKFIVVEKVGENLNLKLFKTVGAGNNIALQNSLLCKDATEIIKFCGNVQHFILTEDVQVENLPFAPEFFRSTADFNFDEVAEVIVWLRENPVENYVAPAKKIAQRLEYLR